MIGNSLSIPQLCFIKEDTMDKKTLAALSKLDWFEMLKTANQMKEIAEYMHMHDEDSYDPEKVELYAGLIEEDVDELQGLVTQINEITEE